MHKLLLASAFSGLLMGSAVAQTCPASGCVKSIVSQTVAGGVVTSTFSDGSTSSLTVAGGIPVTTQPGAYTLKTSDCPSSLIDDTGTAAHSYTVPTGLPVGCAVRIEQTAAGAVSIIAGSGETAEVYNSSNTTAGIGASVTVVIDSASTFLIAPGV